MARSQEWIAAINEALAILTKEAEACLNHDPVPGDNEGTKLAMARAGALLTAKADIEALLD